MICELHLPELWRVTCLLKLQDQNVGILYLCCSKFIMFKNIQTISKTFVAVTEHDGMICCKYFMIISYILCLLSFAALLTHYLCDYLAYLLYVSPSGGHTDSVFVSRVKYHPLGIALVAMRSISLRFDWLLKYYFMHSFFSLII